MAKYEFSNWEYEKSHGISPKGYGHWAFILKNARIEDISPEHFVENVSPARYNTTFWVPGFWTLTEAKKRAAVMLAANAVPAGTVVYVAP